MEEESKQSDDNQPLIDAMLQVYQLYSSITQNTLIELLMIQSEHRAASKNQPPQTEQSND